MSDVLDHRFGVGDPFRLGVEEEYMLLDPETWDLVQRIESLLATAADGAHSERVTAELTQSVLEVSTPVCRTAGDVARSLVQLRAHVAELAAEHGCRFASAGTHPFSLFERQRVTERDRYTQLIDQLQYVARRELVFGLHVHCSVDDPDRAIRLVNGLTLYLPHFLALSASSPFWRGEATGLASSRQTLFAAFPRSGPPPHFSSYAEFAEVVDQLERTGCIGDYTHIWWDIRPHPRLGTVELRVCDAVTRLDDVVAITAFFQALVKAACERDIAGDPLPAWHPTLTTENKWLVARYGLDAPVMDLETGARNRVPVAQLIRRALKELEPHARELGSERELEGVRELLARGNAADRQLRVWNETRDVVAVVEDIAAASAVPAQAAA